ncbi:tetratricopeptide repeat protein [Owenweeksia hongkongensis]|uniref:tetratricopeptide repeat protein n=1 Tax=Owenweeksia hongkongensis TaxID=253245 RepID=UPI003A9073D6
MKQLFAFLTFLSIVTSPFFALAQYSNLSLQQILDSASEMNEVDHRQEVEELINEAEGRLSESTPNRQLLSFYITSGIYFFDGSFIPKSREYFDKALEIAEEIQDSSKIGLVYSHIANTEVKSGVAAEAIKYYEKALSYYINRDDKIYYSILLNMANAYSRVNLHQKALSNLLTAKKYFTENKDYTKLAIVENNIGEIYRININDYDEARTHYKRALVANKKVNNSFGLAQNYHNLSIAFSAENIRDSALYYAKKSVALKQQFGTNGEMASANYLLATTYKQSEVYDEAIKYHNISLKQCRENQLTQGIFHNLMDLGEIYFKIGSFKKSEEMLIECLGMAEESGQLSMFESVYTGLYEVNKAQGNFENALKYFEKMQAILDSIKINQEEQHFAELRTQYEADLAEAENMVLKEKEVAQSQKLKSQQNLLYISSISIILLLLAGAWLIKTLGQRNRAFVREKESSDALSQQYIKLKERESELAESNDLKNKILSVLGHDLRTPLAGISSLLSTMSAVEITREELQDLFGHLKKEVDISLTTLHEILAWARLQMNEISKLIQKLDTKELLNEVVNIYEPNIRAKQLKLELNVSPNTELWADYNQMRSICGNLLSNAIKFTPEKGFLKIDVRDNSEFTEITFCDSGLGIPENVLHNLNNRDGLISNQGTSGESGTGIGLRIVTDFVDAHNGVLHFKNNPEMGTSVSVQIPKPDKRIK